MTMLTERKKTREWMDRMQSIIEHDLLEKLDHVPDESDLAMIELCAGYALRVRLDAAHNRVTAHTWRWSRAVCACLQSLGLTREMTVAAASLRYGAGQG
jgi:hypothetical protein